MPSVSRSQQRLFGAAYAYKKGKNPHAPAAVRKVADGMSKNDLHDFAATRHSRLPEKKADLSLLTPDFLAGLYKFAADRNLDLPAVERLVLAAVDHRLGTPVLTKLAAGMPSIPGFRNISDASHWGVPAGQKPGQAPQQQQQAGPDGKPMSPAQQQENADQQFAASKVPMGADVKNAGGVAPLPHRYRFDLDETVLRIKRDQIAHTQKVSREAQKAQHTAGVGPSAQGQTGPAAQAAPQLHQQHQQQGQQVQQVAAQATKSASARSADPFVNPLMDV